MSWLFEFAGSIPDHVISIIQGNSSLVVQHEMHKTMTGWTSWTCASKHDWQVYHLLCQWHGTSVLVALTTPAELLMDATNRLGDIVVRAFHS